MDDRARRRLRLRRLHVLPAGAVSYSTPRDGRGFCYNTGRFVTAAGPFLVGVAAQAGRTPLEVIHWVAIAPLFGALCIAAGLAEETRGKKLL